MKEERATKSRSGQMLDASSTRSISRMLRRPLQRRSSVSPRSMPSRPRSEAVRRRYADRLVRHEQNRCSRVCARGWKPRSRSSPASPIPRRRSATPPRAGRQLTRHVDDGQLEIDNNAAERAVRVVALGPSDARTTSPVDRTRKENEPLPTIRCSAQPS